MHTLTLTPEEIAILNRQHESVDRDGGWQALLARLRGGVDPHTGVVMISAEDLARIPRYAFAYGNGGWEARLRGAFERTLGPRLGG